MARNFFYDREDITVTDYPGEAQFDFCFKALNVIIVNDSKETIIFKFKHSGNVVDGEIFRDDGPLVLDHLGEDKLWFKLGSGTSAQVRVWAWRK